MKPAECNLTIGMVFGRPAPDIRMWGDRHPLLAMSTHRNKTPAIEAEALDDGGIRLYDPDNDAAWIRSDVTIPLPAA